MLHVEVKQSYLPTQLWYDNNCMQQVGMFFFFFLAASEETSLQIFLIYLLAKLFAFQS